MNQPQARLVAFLTLLLLAVAGPVCAADAPSPADTAWKELRKAATPHSPPREWSDQRPGDEEIRAFQKKQGAKALTAADKAKDFYTQFPEDNRAGESLSL